MLEYIVVNYQDLEELVIEVQRMLDQGWQLVGGICCGPISVDKEAMKGVDYIDVEWAQAMCKEK